VRRRFTFKAIGGVSMGGQGAGSIAFRHPERFDAVGMLGADPGVDARYILSFMREILLGGFCSAEDQAAGRGRIGELCAGGRQALPGQWERLEDWEHMIFEEGEGTGLTLKRDTYLKALRDLTRAHGNAVLYAGSVSGRPEWYLPPGVPRSVLAQERPCEQPPVVLANFFDRRFNPDGAFPVITFCDGGDRSAGGGGRGYGVFDPAVAQTNPVQVLLAADVNGNGRRDSGEPLVTQFSEPFRDVGTDGVPSREEPGYEAATNPDPAGDDYHYVRNPTGTEGNWIWDGPVAGTPARPGEPWEDAGLDGVLGRGCPTGSAPGCYDYGEGNHAFDYNPSVQYWFEHSAPVRFQTFTPAQRARLNIWADAGIRDFFNATPATNQFIGALRAAGEDVRVYDGFDRLLPGQVFDWQAVDWPNVGRHVYVRYGNPDATPDDVLRGDGRHVGTPLEVVYRVNSVFAWFSANWPGGDRSYQDLDTTRSFQRDLTFNCVACGNRETPFSVFVPPGYFAPANASVRYPVIYFLHGYGQSPDDMVDASALFANQMINRNIPEARRFQKFIVVYVDGRCRPGYDVRDQVAPATGDGCEKGTFYVDQRGDGQAKMEAAMLELMDHIDAQYRTKHPEEIEVVQ
jgi:hypothetical protein